MRDLELQLRGPRSHPVDLFSHPQPPLATLSHPQPPAATLRGDWVNNLSSAIYNCGLLGLWHAPQPLKLKNILQA